MTYDCIYLYNTPGWWFKWMPYAWCLRFKIWRARKLLTTLRTEAREIIHRNDKIPEYSRLKLRYIKVEEAIVWNEQAIKETER